MRLRRNLGRIPTPEEINVELKIKPHRNPYSTMTEKERRKEFRAHRMRLRYRLGRNPTKQEIHNEMANPRYIRPPHNDPTREKRKKIREQLRERHPGVKRLADVRFTEIEQFIVEFFDYNLYDITGTIDEKQNLLFIANQKHLDKLTDEEFFYLTTIKDDLPKLVEELIRLLLQHKLSDRRDIL